MSSTNTRFYRPCIISIN